MSPRPKIPPRIVLYPKDVENITGRSGRTARKMLQMIREVFGKPPYALSPFRNSLQSTIFRKRSSMNFRKIRLYDALLFADGSVVKFFF
jgi:hypothetical protein